MTADDTGWAGGLPWPEDVPPKGTPVLDTRTQAIGIVMDATTGRVQLRPPAGGKEWDARHTDIQELSPREQLSAKVAVANHQTAQTKGAW